MNVVVTATVTSKKIRGKSNDKNGRICACLSDWHFGDLIFVKNRGVPVVRSSTSINDSSNTNGQKRSREEDETAANNDNANNPPAKKVDVKEG